MVLAERRFFHERPFRISPRPFYRPLQRRVMLEEEDVTINHWMKFDRPHIYKCTCGYVQTIFPIGDTNSYSILERPASKVEYMSCGHAVCARLENGECAICRNKGV